MDELSRDTSEDTYSVMRRVLLRAAALGFVALDRFDAGRHYFQERHRDYEAAGSPYGAHFNGLLQWLAEDEARLRGRGPADGLRGAFQDDSDDEERGDRGWTK